MWDAHETGCLQTQVITVYVSERSSGESTHQLNDYYHRVSLSISNQRERKDTINCE
jgi:hypothetical protein